GPNDGERVHARGRPQAKVRTRIDRGFEAACGHHFDELMRTAGGNHHLCADSCSVRPRASEGYGEVVVTGAVQLAHAIAVHGGGCVEIVHHEIERAVVIEIDVRG